MKDATDGREVLSKKDPVRVRLTMAGVASGTSRLKESRSWDVFGRS